MNGAPIQNPWTEANQRALVAEFARLKLRLGAEGDAQAPAREVDEARAALPAPAAIDALTEVFGLSAFERDILLLAAGVEMDAELARRCGEAQGYPQRSYATFGVALAALENSHWSALAAIGPLRRWRLLEVDESAGLVAGRLHIDERILHYLAGVNYLDYTLAAVASTSGRTRSHGGGSSEDLPGPARGSERKPHASLGGFERRRSQRADRCRCPSCRADGIAIAARARRRPVAKHR